MVCPLKVLKVFPGSTREDQSYYAGSSQSSKKHRDKRSSRSSGRGDAESQRQGESSWCPHAWASKTKIGLSWKPQRSSKAAIKTRTTEITSRDPDSLVAGTTTGQLEGLSGLELPRQ